MITKYKKQNDIIKNSNPFSTSSQAPKSNRRPLRMPKSLSIVEKITTRSLGEFNVKSKLAMVDGLTAPDPNPSRTREIKPTIK